MTKSPSKEMIAEAIMERSKGTDPKLAGFVFDDIVFEFGATPSQILEAAEHLLLWTRVQLAMENTQNAIGPKPDPADVPKEEGYVYIFKNGVYSKIGSSKNPKARLNAINRSIPPGNPRVLFWAKYKALGFRDAERQLREVFESKRVDEATGGVEWFKLSIDDLEWISKFMAHWDGENRFGLDFDSN